ncbi:MAG: 5-(carboxyamino)imidazole ribonucleotide synthase [Candidatus Dormibacteria bacterium]
MGARIGCLGGGQLGRMLALAGYPMGLTFTFLEPQPNSSAGQVARQLLGAYQDPALLAELSSRSDLVTFEFESVPEESARALLAACPVFPPPAALRAGQDRLEEKRLFGRLGIPAAEFAVVDSPEDLSSALASVGRPARLKARRLSYDGHGQAAVGGGDQAQAAFVRLGGVPSILERDVPFSRELSVIGVRSEAGETAFYPLIENHHQDSVLRLSLAPAPAAGPDLQAQAEAICRAVLDELEYQGVLTVELFQVGERLLANEIAPRVHNSGHWTLDGAATSQFENHLRAGLGWPLGSTRGQGVTAMVNLLGEAPDPALVLGIEGAHLHLYGKSPRPGRKLGHVNITAGDPATVTASALELGRRLGVDLPEPLHRGSYWPQ